MHTKQRHQAVPVPLGTGKDLIVWPVAAFFRHLLDPAHKICYHEVITRPPEGDFLRQQFADIIPGYYMNKVHWNSVCTDGAVPDDLLKEMLDKSYALVLSGFSKKKQQEILGR